MKIRSLVLALVLGALPFAASHAAVDLSITVAPPELQVYDQPPCPTDGYLWTPGYWAYDDGGYYWVAGAWVPPPRVGYLWTPPYWGFDNGFYAFHDGYWGSEVGFYGGINYGFGYGGYGYDGGRWDGRTFRYNTAVTHVNVQNIHNTYEDRTVIHENNNRTSFNGQGGVQAQADARQRAAANSKHLKATSGQVQAQRLAQHGAHVGTPAGANKNGENHGPKNAGNGNGNGNGREGRGQGNPEPRTVNNPPGHGGGKGHGQGHGGGGHPQVRSGGHGGGGHGGGHGGGGHPQVHGGGGGHPQGHGGGGHPQPQGHGGGGGKKH